MGWRQGSAVSAPLIELERAFERILGRARSLVGILTTESRWPGSVHFCTTSGQTPKSWTSNLPQFLRPRTIYGLACPVLAPSHHEQRLESEPQGAQRAGNRGAYNALIIGQPR